MNPADRKLKNTIRKLVADHVDPLTGEVNCTALAEAAADECDVNHPGGPLDQDTHSIWEWTVDIARAHEACDHPQHETAFCPKCVVRKRGNRASRVKRNSN